MVIHETVPISKMEKINKKEIEIKRGILKYLKFGKENAIKSYELSKLIGLNKTATNQKIRKCCKDLLVFQGVPIISCTKGFYKTHHSFEIDEYIENLEARIRGLQRDIGALKLIREELI